MAGIIEKELGPSGIAKFSKDSCNAFIRAEEQANRLKENILGTHHLLLGVLTGEDRDPARAALNRLGIRMDILISDNGSAIDQIGNQTNLVIGINLPLQRVLEQAVCEAQRDKAPQAHTLHLLRALAIEKEGNANAVLSFFGVTLDKLSQEAIMAAPEQSPTPKKEVRTIQQIQERLLAYWRNPGANPINQANLAGGIDEVLDLIEVRERQNPSLGSPVPK